MWADTLLAAERAHLFRLLVWGALSALTGTAVLAMLSRRIQESRLAWPFAIQTALWGTAEVVFALIQWTRLSLRDLSGAARLDRILWLQLGLAIGVATFGFAIAIAAWLMNKRLGPVGAGLAIGMHGIALAILTASLRASIGIPR
jgi:hypothetical protein